MIGLFLGLKFPNFSGGESMLAINVSFLSSQSEVRLYRSCRKRYIEPFAPDLLLKKSNRGFNFAYKSRRLLWVDFSNFPNSNFRSLSIVEVLQEREKIIRILGLVNRFQGFGFLTSFWDLFEAQQRFPNRSIRSV